jgi:nitrate/nitrite-specific signal transduction histidine kinase
MKERAAILGGDVTIRRARGNGTVVALEVPKARVALPLAPRGDA